MQIHRAELTLLEPTFFASREVSAFFQTEPLLGNYALAYALGLCQSPYHRSGGPRYREDLEALNREDVYVTPGTFRQETIRFTVTQFNALSDTYWYRFDQNATTLDRREKARPANFPQSGRIRMLGRGCRAVFYLLDNRDRDRRPPRYVRLGKFDSKARIDWARPTWTIEERDAVDVPFLLNPRDLPGGDTLRVFTLHAIHPTPLTSRTRLSGRFYRLADDTLLPDGMRFGLEGL
ncbi:MAG: type I-D CRISPR-associated protein Cas5/Csc1 [Chloroflexota bacterium]